MQLRSISIAAVLLSIYFIVQFLDISQSILIPFIFAVLICNLLSTIANFFQQAPHIGHYIPRWIAITIAFLLLIVVFSSIGKILTENTQKIILSSQSIQTKMNALLGHLADKGYSKTYLIDGLQNLLKQIDFQKLILGFYSTVSTIMSSLFLMVLFVIFFFIEQTNFAEKLVKIFPKKSQHDKVMTLLKTIPDQIQFYLGMKTLFSAITGFAIYIVLKIMDMEFAAFWGILVFLMNFIPNIGAIAITVIITIVAYFQWYDWAKVMIVFFAQLSVHVVIGNLVETHYLGRTMHLSPLFLIISLCFWGKLWGGTGLFLAVPMTVLLMIILGSFESTRIYAMMLSEKGELPKDCDV